MESSLIGKAPDFDSGECRFEPRLSIQRITEYSAVWLAYLVWNQRVAGSNPATPTKIHLLLTAVGDKCKVLALIKM
tara:strand:+ start:802 stop:1029 length:228 start_codon:yes stop_codon:yes gene_type:complete